jgi:hypothetical protein
MEDPSAQTLLCAAAHHPELLAALYQNVDLAAQIARDKFNITLTDSELGVLRSRRREALQAAEAAAKNTDKATVREDSGHPTLGVGHAS